jgi:redox-sensitive bicupin YhaK (pirin superfamily)
VRGLFAAPLFVDVTLPAGGLFEQPVARGHTALLYVHQGPVTVGGAPPVPAPRLVILGDGDVVRVRAPDGPARFLLLSAQPLDEPYARYGPFVMNTPDEIDQALRELRDGTFVKRAAG